MSISTAVAATANNAAPAVVAGAGSAWAFYLQETGSHPLLFIFAVLGTTLALIKALQNKRRPLDVIYIALASLFLGTTAAPIIMDYYGLDSFGLKVIACAAAGAFGHELLVEDRAPIKRLLERWLGSAPKP